MTAEQNRESNEHLNVVIAGGGVAGLEAAFALRELASGRVAVKLVSSSGEFIYRPLSIGEPFSSSRATHYPLAPLVTRAGAELVSDTVVAVDPDRRVAETAGGAHVAYDALLLGVGAKLHRMFEHATTVDDARMDELLHGLVQDVEGGYVRRLAVVVPAPTPWPLPAYELALMASERAWDMQAELDITLLTPERMPLEVFGAGVSRALAEMLARRRVEVVTSAYCEIPRPQLVVVHPSGRSVAADRIVAFPQLQGPHLDGLPSDGGGFIPVDEYGRVRGVDRVWAAGDATDYPIKQGGVAAQLAAEAAASIAALAGASVDVRPFSPILEGVLMTGARPVYLRATPASPDSDGESVFTEIAPGAAPPKIVTRYLGPHLAEADSSAVRA